MKRHKDSAENEEGAVKKTGFIRKRRTTVKNRRSFFFQTLDFSQFPFV
jgi:hypothetical protein